MTASNGPLAAQTPPTQRGTVDETGRFTPAAPPALTEVQKLTIQLPLKDMEIAQRDARLAQLAFDAARAELTKTLQTLQVPGYTLNLQTLLYDPVPSEPKPEAKP